MRAGGGEVKRDGRKKRKLKTKFYTLPQIIRPDAYNFIQLSDLLDLIVPEGRSQPFEFWTYSIYHSRKVLLPAVALW